MSEIELIEELKDALSALLKRDMRNTCPHEETHRGGTQWEICDQCGARWADDTGGRPEWKDPAEWAEAQAVIDKAQALLAEDEDEEENEKKPLNTTMIVQYLGISLMILALYC